MPLAATYPMSRGQGTSRFGRQMPISKRQRYLKRRQALIDERKTWEDVWKDVCDNYLPRRARFVSTDRNRKRRNTKIVNPFPRLAHETLVNFLMENMCSKARSWYGLRASDEEVADKPRVKQYCDDVVGSLREVMASSNFYSTTKTVIGDLILIGSAAGQWDEDDDDVIRGYVFPVGTYCFANSASLRVDTVVRDLSMTVSQMVERFGYEACSYFVRSAWDNHDYDQWVDVVHVVEPNRDYNPLLKRQPYGYRGFPWRSCYFELGSAGSTTKTIDESSDALLAEEGNWENPMFAPRWDVRDEDVYGSSPCMDGNGACDALQLMAKRLASLTDKTVSPPMNAPTSALTKTVSILSGDWNFYDVMGGGQKIEPALLIPPGASQEARENIAMYEQWIGKILKNDVWLFNLRNQPGGENIDLTATEAQIRDNEKLQLLGAMTDRVEDEYFEPSITRIMNIAARAGRLPPPPPELVETLNDGRTVGKRLKIEYVSEMAQAKKAVAIASLQRMAQYMTLITQLKGLPPAIDGDDPRDVVDFDEGVQVVGEALNLDSKVLLPDEQVQARRQARQKAQQAQAQAATAAQQAQTVRNLGQAPVQGGQSNALDLMLQQGQAAADAGGQG